MIWAEKGLKGDLVPAPLPWGQLEVGQIWVWSLLLCVFAGGYIKGFFVCHMLIFTACAVVPDNSAGTWIVSTSVSELCHEEYLYLLWLKLFYVQNSFRAVVPTHTEKCACICTTAPWESGPEKPSIINITYTSNSVKSIETQTGLSE